MHLIRETFHTYYSFHPLCSLGFQEISNPPTIPTPVYSGLKIKRLCCSDQWSYVCVYHAYIHTYILLSKILIYHKMKQKRYLLSRRGLFIAFLTINKHLQYTTDKLTLMVTNDCNDLCLNLLLDPLPWYIPKKAKIGIENHN